MTASEVQEFIVDSIAAATGSPTEASNLRPSGFGPLSGFRFELSYLNEDGLEMVGMALASVYQHRLLLILYTGTRLHYFPRYQQAVERLFSSIELKASKISLRLSVTPQARVVSSPELLVLAHRHR